MRWLKSSFLPCFFRYALNRQSIGYKTMHKANPKGIIRIGVKKAVQIAFPKTSTKPSSGMSKIVQKKE
ncbi:hypothetical protein CBLAS_0938 [Campylobacter blaseri]|uniref:Uncharacterized protein n=1 Tax=Campylobacter blaseri TaxID=2042961 RepID=A0A2P8QYP8_9BACT|nr:hypothetical protein [Campylobacter blaseri]PSM51372.1 hypothetical protein CQ405_08255 [Campylobacter blaseri]PSM52822.1 hypothetical protein CRN67_08260 [Campylobacter blaseri]QKF86123.1 hypothetical protein CBLAS_0938 [Campylobacter blaseri]